MRGVAIVVVLCACDGVFGVRFVPDRDATAGDGSSDAPAPFDRCAPQPLDALRYGVGLQSTGFDFTLARTRCSYKGMDLADLDDEAEWAYVMQHVSAWQSNAPEFLGATDNLVENTFVGVDGCPAVLHFSQNEPNGGAAENCVELDSAWGDQDGTCAGNFGGTQLTAAACETPRWPDATCLAAATRPANLTMLAGPVTFATARTQCAATGGHLLEIDSTAELTAATALAGNNAFWVDAQWDVTMAAWESGTGCPELFGWAPGYPLSVPGATVCAQISATGGAKDVACDTFQTAICEM